jgi:uncharacterized protein YcbK (DUF882 family)
VTVPSDGFTVILLTSPGAPARQLNVPRAWPAFIGVFSMLSVCGSLLIGREARALCDGRSELTAEPAVVASIHEGAEGVSELPASTALGSRARGRASTGGLASRHRETLQGISRVPALAPLPVAKSVAAPAAKPSVLPAAPRPLLSGKALPLFDINGARSLKVTPFDQDGVPNAEAFAQIRSFMRCRRSGHEMDMDPRLIAVLSRISQHFGEATLQVISGHRKADGKTTRETSQHASGTAADIRIAGVAIEELKRVAHELGAKGVGLYTKGQFVHDDVRERAYTWRDKGDESDDAEGAPETAAVVAEAPVVAAAD